MSAQAISLNRHSSRRNGNGGWFTGAFGLWGGPAAWFIQLCAGYALASGPCFAHYSRHSMVREGLAWTWPALIAVSLCAVLVALAACWVSWGVLKRTRKDAPENGHAEAEWSRTRFLALWGMVYGAGFAVAALVTAIAYIVLPRCMG
jgi:hypothetical protein